MYQFRITKQDSGGYRFELNGIKLLVEDYEVSNDNHLITNPQKAFGYFNLEDNLYGVSNAPTNFPTAEAFFDAMYKQFGIFKQNGKKSA